MAATFPPLSERFLRRLLGPVAFARGQEIAASGGVALVRADGHGVEGHGTGTGPAGDAWEASALVSGEEIRGARCSCAAFARSGQPCKHLAALLLAAGRDEAPPALAPPPSAAQGSADSPEGAGEASGEALEPDVPAPAPPRVTDVGAWLPAEEAPAVPRQLDMWILAEGNALLVQVLAIEGADKDPVAIDPRAAMASQATRPTPDRPALRVLSEAALRGHLSPGGEVRVEGEDAAELLGALAGRRVFFGPDRRPLRYLTDVLRPRIDLAPLPSGGLGASVSFERKSDASRLSPGHGLWFPGAPGWHLDPDGPGGPGGPVAQPVDRRVSPSALGRILGAPAIEETPDRLVTFLTTLLPRVASEIGAEMPRLDQALDLRPPVPTFCLEASGTLTAAQVTLTALYDDVGVPVSPTSPGVPLVVVPPRGDDPRPGAVRCDLAAHRDAASRLRALGFRPAAEGSNAWEALADKAIAFWGEGISLLPDTWDLLMPSELGETVIREQALAPRARVSGGTEALFLDLHFESEGVRCRREDLLLAVEEGRRYVPLEDRSFASFDLDFIRGLLDREREIRRGARPDGGINLTQGGRIQELLEQFDDFVIDDEARGTFHTIANIHSLALLRKPRCLQATLRPYQQQGLAWLKFIHDMRSGGILADQMGMGKSLQTIAILGLVKQIDANLRALIVCPTSLTSQWIGEIAKFTPSIRTFLWHGAERASFKEEAMSAEILVTSYPILVRDEDFFRDLPFDYVVLDEAQVIKNPRGATAKAAKKLRSVRRLALTGTPVSNRLSDLWALFDFVNPDLLGSAQDFEERYAGPIGEGDSVMAYRLRQAVRPFMLRRTKEEVNIDLPSKVEIDRFCDMTETQRQFYDAIHREVVAWVKGEIQRSEGKSAHMHILTGITRLRQAACDIRLIDREGTYDPGESSGKMRVLREIVESCVAGGHKVLIFSSFTEVLGIVRQTLDQDGVSYEYLDGSTKDRGDRVDHFQNDPSCSAFLISLKAGGTGLNLTAADVVIHMDPWWNPAAEDQATDRAHRIGQQRSVTVYRLYSQGTIEDKIILLKAKKRDIAASVLTSNVGASGAVTSQDYLEMLGVTDVSIVSDVSDVPVGESSVDLLPSETGDVL